MSELNSTQIKAIAKERAELNRQGWFLSTVSKPSYIMGFEEGVEYAQKLASEAIETTDPALPIQGVSDSSSLKEEIFVSHGNDGDDDVYCAFTDKDRGTKDCEECGTVLTRITLHRGAI